MSEVKIPKGWKLSELFEIAEVQTGKKDANYATDDGEFYFFTCAMEPLKAPNFSYEGEVLLLPGNGANVGQVIYFKGKFEAYQRTYIISNIKIEPRFLYYYFLAFWREVGTSTQYGSATNYIKIGNFKDFKILNPPLSEQQRIVAKLDEVFGHLDRVREKLDRIPELLKKLRQQVLTQAVTGELTREWREGKDLGERERKKLEQFSESKLGKMLDQAKNKGELTDYLRNINVRWFEINFSDVYQMKIEKSELHKYELKYGDVLVCEGGEPGRAAIWKDERSNVIFQKALHRIRLSANVLPEYFLYNLFIDASTEKLNEFFTGTTIKHLTGKSFAKYEIDLPTTEEQKEIINRVDSLFQIADKIESQYQSLKAKIDNLPQAILAKAFRGELVGQEVKEYVREAGEVLMAAEGAVEYRSL